MLARQQSQEPKTQGLADLLRTHRTLAVELAFATVLSLMAPMGTASKDAVGNAVASIAGALMGLIVAVLLVSYSPLRQSYSTLAYHQTVSQAAVVRCFVLYPFALVSALGALLGQTRIHGCLATASAVTIVLCLAELFPAVKRFLEPPTSARSIAALVTRIEGCDWANLTDTGRDSASRTQSNAPYMLALIALSALRDGDVMTPTKIINILTERVAADVSAMPSHSRTGALDGYSTAIGWLTAEALSRKAEGVLCRTFECVTHIAQSYMTSGDWFSFEALWGEEFALLRRCLNEGLPDTFAAGIRQMGDQYELYLSAIGPLDDVSMRNEFIVWEMLLRRICGLGAMAIDREDARSLAAVLAHLESIALTVPGRSWIAEKWQAVLVQWSYDSCGKIAIAAATRRGIVPRNPFLRVAGLRRELLQIGLQIFGQVVVELSTHGLADPDWIRDIAEIGCALVAQDSHSLTAPEGVIFICQVLDRAGLELSARNPSMVPELITQAESICQCASPNTHPKALASIQCCISALRQLSDARSSSGTLRWPRIDES